MILCLRMRTRSSSGRLWNLRRYQRRQASTEALVHTHDDTATPAQKTAIGCSCVSVIDGRPSNSHGSAQPC